MPVLLHMSNRPEGLEELLWYVLLAGIASDHVLLD